ncbi:MAG: GNAT family N-acetyltransferase [Candidatus Marinimicrobia bacterium]|nr:GNAT family N-acetyltransferase [Candidatus Neomarinimicrobiota bacterium]
MTSAINEEVFVSFPNFETQRLLLRRFRLSDAERLFEIRSNFRVMRYMDTFPEPNIQAIRHKIQEMNLAFDLKLGLNWAIMDKQSDKMIGYFGIWRIEWDNCRGEIGYSLDPDYWGNGYMSEVFQTIIPFGFRQLNLHSMEANINPHNESSRKILLKHGFVKEAYFQENFFFDGQFLDSEIYSLLEKNFISRPNSHS